MFEKEPCNKGSFFCAKQSDQNCAKEEELIMKKKLISCILVSTMAVSLLAGCGSSKKEEGSAVSDVFQIWVIKLSSWIYASITGNSASDYDVSYQCESLSCGHY